MEFTCNGWGADEDYIMHLCIEEAVDAYDEEKDGKFNEYIWDVERDVLHALDRIRETGSGYVGNRNYVTYKG